VRCPFASSTASGAPPPSLLFKTSLLSSVDLEGFFRLSGE